MSLALHFIIHLLLCVPCLALHHSSSTVRFNRRPSPDVEPRLNLQGHNRKLKLGLEACASIKVASTQPGALAGRMGFSLNQRRQLLDEAEEAVADLDLPSDLSGGDEEDRSNRSGCRSGGGSGSDSDGEDRNGGGSIDIPPHKGMSIPSVIKQAMEEHISPQLVQEQQVKHQQVILALDLSKADESVPITSSQGAEALYHPTASALPWVSASPVNQKQRQQSQAGGSAKPPSRGAVAGGVSVANHSHLMHAAKDPLASEDGHPSRPQSDGGGGGSSTLSVSEDSARNGDVAAARRGQRDVKDESGCEGVCAGLSDLATSPGASSAGTGEDAEIG